METMDARKQQRWRKVAASRLELQQTSSRRSRSPATRELVLATESWVPLTFLIQSKEAKWWSRSWNKMDFMAQNPISATS